jgi:hypothetical protein
VCRRINGMLNFTATGVSVAPGEGPKWQCQEGATAP